MLEVLVEVFGEFLLQLLGEALFELGLHSLAEPFKKQPNVWLAVVGYALFGLVSGGLSLVVFPHHLSPAGLARAANLFLTPIIVGACMGGMGAWRRRRGEPLFLINRFLYGFIFAAAVAALRFHFAQ